MIAVAPFFLLPFIGVTLRWRGRRLRRCWRRSGCLRRRFVAL
jgi:hypothetical protein